MTTHTFKVTRRNTFFPVGSYVHVEINTAPKAKEWGVYLVDGVLNLLKSEDASMPNTECVGRIKYCFTDEVQQVSSNLNSQLNFITQGGQHINQHV